MAVFFYDHIPNGKVFPKEYLSFIVKLIGKDGYKGMIFLGELNIIEVITGILVWAIIGYLAYRIYKKQSARPKMWKLIFAIFLGLFSFSINWNMSEHFIKIPILPLGVWILYLIMRGKKERWPFYRPYAWLGFAANFLFLVSALLLNPLHQLIYPQSKLSTYMANMEKASLIQIHSATKNGTFDKDGLQKKLGTMTLGDFYNDEWYRQMYMSDEGSKREERFPYQLVGVAPKFGSGIDEVIYVENDGKGILIETPTRQLYFRSNESFVKEGK